LQHHIAAPNPKGSDGTEFDRKLELQYKTDRNCTTNGIARPPRQNGVHGCAAGLPIRNPKSAIRNQLRPCCDSSISAGHRRIMQGFAVSIANLSPLTDSWPAHRSTK